MDIISIEDALQLQVDQVTSVAVKVLSTAEVTTYKNKDNSDRRYFAAIVADETSHTTVRVYKMNSLLQFTQGANLMLKDVIRKNGDSGLWLVSSSTVVNWCEIDVPAAIIVASTKPKGQTAESVKLADAIRSSSASHIVGKIVQTSPLKYRRNGELPIRFVTMKDCDGGPTVKVALFGADAQKTICEGDVIGLTDTYRYKDSNALSTKKTTKFEYLPQDMLSVSVSSNDELDDDDFLDLDILNEPEEFQVKGVISAHVYRCCPKPACRNKKLDTLTCPTCKASDASQPTYYCTASLVLKRQHRHETRKSFMPDLQQLVDLPPINTLADDYSLRDFLTSKLPVNARGTFRNGGLMIISTKRHMP